MSTLQRQTHILEVWGDLACIASPANKVERFSYPCPTPSAARGIYEAVYFKPEFRWQIERIELLNPPSYIALRRNEVKDKVSVPAVYKWMEGKAPVDPIWADGDKGQLGTDAKGRTQRQTMALRNPHFRLHARILPRSGKEQQQAAYDRQFARRAAQGKCWTQPCFGAREFVAFFRYLESLTDQPAACAYTADLGLMLYDVFDLQAVNDQFAEPFVSLFHARIFNGVLEVPPYESAAVLKPERSVR